MKRFSPGAALPRSVTTGVIWSASPLRSFSVGRSWRRKAGNFWIEASMSARRAAVAWLVLFACTMKSANCLRLAASGVST